MTRHTAPAAPAVTGIAALAIDCAEPERLCWVVLRDPEGNEFCLLRPRG